MSVVRQKTTRARQGDRFGASGRRESRGYNFLLPSDETEGRGWLPRRGWHDAGIETGSFELERVSRVPKERRALGDCVRQLFTTIS